MSPRLLTCTTFAAVLGCGLVAGVFFAFSSFVMPALVRLPAAQGIQAMQSINITAVTRWFMLAFLGTAVLCLVLAIGSFALRSEPRGWLRIGGSLLYLVGSIGVTGAFNVPRNDRLASILADSSGAATYWQSYSAEWGAWNHVRAVTALAAAALLLLALLED
jgi:uncharacterized membrane protein